MKNIHPLRTARRKAKRLLQPAKLGCVFCVEDEHSAGRNHDPQLTFPDICQRHHDEITENRRNADVSMLFERDPIIRVALALKATSVFLHMLADAMWRWANLLDQSEDQS